MQESTGHTQVQVVLLLVDEAPLCAEMAKTLIRAITAESMIVFFIAMLFL